LENQKNTALGNRNKGSFQPYQISDCRIQDTLSEPIAAIPHVFFVDTKIVIFLAIQGNYSTKGRKNQRMSRKGNCLGNAVMENFFGHWHNYERIKLNLNGLKPVSYRLKAA